MPNGVVQWFDPATREGAIVRAGRVFAVRASDMEAQARHPGARVHFDISHKADTARAVNVTLHEGTRTSPRQGRFGDLVGARRPDTKGTAPFAHAHTELGRTLAVHPVEVARAWAQRVQAGDLDAALSLYAPDAVVHTALGSTSGRAHLRAYLDDSGLVGTRGTPDIRGTDGTVTVTWRHTALDGPGLAVRCRVQHGLVAEQWSGPATFPPTHGGR